VCSPKILFYFENINSSDLEKLATIVNKHCVSAREKDLLWKRND